MKKYNPLHICLTASSLIISLILIFGGYTGNDEKLFIIAGVLCLGFLYIGELLEKLIDKTLVILFLFLPLLSNAQYSFTEVSLPTVSVNEYESDLLNLDRDVKVVSVQEIIGDSVQQVGCSEVNLLSLVSKYAISKTEVHGLEIIVSYQLVGLDCISQTNFHYRSNRLVRIIIETTTHKESKTTLFNL